MKGQPSGGNERCVEINYLGKKKWNDVICTAKKFSVCELNRGKFRLRI